MSAVDGAQQQVQLKTIQDALVLDPTQHSFFRTRYMKHTNFATAEAEQSTTSTASLGTSNIMTEFDRAGDLLSQCYLVPTFDAIIPSTAADYNSGANYVSWTNGLGYAMIDEISIRLNQKPFDTMDGQIMFMREKLMSRPNHTLGQAVGWYDSRTERMAASMQPQQLHIPLQFWFCNYIEQSLPTVGMDFTKIKCVLDTKSQGDLLYAFGGGYSSGGTSSNFTTNGLTDLHYLLTFRYLDQPERVFFSTAKLQHIFVQHQNLGDVSWTTSSSSVQTFNIRFSMPVKQILWAPIGAFTSGTNTDWNRWFNSDGVTYQPFTDGPTLVQDAFKSAQIYFNNSARTIELPAKFLRQISHLNTQRRLPDETLNERIYGYSFCLDASNLQDTGSANFTRYDNATIRLNLWTSADSSGYISSGDWTTGATMRFYALNTNLAKFERGQSNFKFAA